MFLRVCLGYTQPQRCSRTEYKSKQTIKNALGIKKGKTETFEKYVVYETNCNYATESIKATAEELLQHTPANSWLIKNA